MKLCADAALAKLHFRWRTALIVRELEEEVCRQTRAKLCFAGSSLQHSYVWMRSLLVTPLFKSAAVAQVLALEKGRQHRQELKVLICSAPHWGSAGSAPSSCLVETVAKHACVCNRS